MEDANGFFLTLASAPDAPGMSSAILRRLIPLRMARIAKNEPKQASGARERIQCCQTLLE